MTNLPARFSALFLFLLCLACSNEQPVKKEKADITNTVPGKIVQTWNFARFEAGDGLRKTIEPMFKGKPNPGDSVEKSIRMAVETNNMMMNGAYYEFRSDNSCTSGIMGQTVNGTYSFAQNYTEIIMNQRQGSAIEIDTFIIAVLNDSQLVMRMKGDMGAFHFRAAGK